MQNRIFSNMGYLIGSLVKDILKWQNKRHKKTFYFIKLDK